MFSSFLSENQHFLKEILRGVVNGEGVGWLSSKRLKKLMTEEYLRLLAANRLYSAPTVDEDSDVVEDEVSSSCCCCCCCFFTAGVRFI